MRYGDLTIPFLESKPPLYDMGGGKVNRIIAQNPILKEWVREHDTVEQKTVGENIIHYRGTWTTKAAMMVSSQCNVHDEVDASNADVITQYETRLQGQKGGWRWYFSHPSVAGHGVDVYWQMSDKKEWVIKCGGMKFMEAVLRVRADVVKEVVRVPARGIRANQRLAAVIE